MIRGKGGFAVFEQVTASNPQIEMRVIWRNCDFDDACANSGGWVLTREWE